jgi:23S rRNA-/tRNA-specific pseudouridylate synthase
VIYNENDIVAFDKPYGMACQGGRAGDVAFISKHLSRLGKDLRAKDGQLHFVHRIDKGCTGVVVYAKTPEMAALLKSSFAQRKVVKIYWAILKGTPQPDEGNFRCRVVHVFVPVLQ